MLVAWLMGAGVPSTGRESAFLGATTPATSRDTLRTRGGCLGPPLLEPHDEDTSGRREGSGAGTIVPPGPLPRSGSFRAGSACS